MVENYIHPLDDYPDHQRIVGRMILAYADLESVLVSLNALALKISPDDAARLVFRARSEADRLNLSDAVLHPFYKKIDLSGPYSSLLGTLRHCKNIRNQYAHSVWVPRNSDEPAFASLDEPAQSKEGEAEITFKPVSLGLLQEQDRYFGYAQKLAHYMFSETYFRLDRRRKHKTPLPKAMRQPKMHNHRS